MAKKITKPTNMVDSGTFTWDNFSSRCINGEYVLVVGSEAVLDKNQNTEANGDSKRLLFDYVMEGLQNRGIMLGSVNDFTQLSYTINNVRHLIWETMSEMEFEVEEVEPSLRKLLSTKYFRMVLTTSFDPYIEVAMREVWGDELRVMDLYDDTGRFAGFDLPIAEQSGGEFNDIRPTLYYVFGRANADNKDKNYVVTENDSMQVVAKWLGSEAPKNLLSYLREKRILALGCKFDDWLFRFFWYLLKQDLALLKEGEVAISFDEKEDAKLINYLKRENIKSFGDARIFMCNALENIELVQGQLNNNRHKGGVFISYCNEDYAVAVNIFSRLTKEGYNVWLDKEQLHPGHEYDDKISNAIAECKVFMPILSTRVKNDLEEDLHRYYRDVEWKLAQDRYLEDKNLDSRSFFIVPVAVGLYDVRGEIHQKTPECIMRSTAYIVGKEEFWHLKEMLNDFLK